MKPDSLAPEIAEIERLLARRLGLKGRDLAHQLARAGRKLPAAQKAQAEALNHAAQQLAHPKLAPMADLAEARQAHRRLRHWLRGVDRTDQILGSVVGVAASIAFAVLFVAALVIALLAWRGFI